MAETPPITPWLVHPRMIPKWAGLGAAGILSLLLARVGQWWLVPIGFLIFFPLEYGVHRGIYHFLADRPAGKLLSRNHVQHHQDPEDLDHLFNDPRFSVSIGVVLFGVYLAVTRDPGGAAMISLGNFAGLIHYEWIHFQAHRPGIRPATPWVRLAKKLHLLHHYKHEDYWYGVTNPGFDLALGTWADPDEVPKSETVKTLVPPEEVEELLEGD